MFQVTCTTTSPLHSTYSYTLVILATCRKIQYMPELYPVRSDYLYNNNMYSVLGAVLEQVFGASWEELVTSELYAPIGMNSSTFYDLAAPDYDGFTTPYTYNISSDDPTSLQPMPYDIWS